MTKTLVLEVSGSKWEEDENELDACVDLRGEGHMLVLSFGAGQYPEWRQFARKGTRYKLTLEAVKP